MQFGFLGLLPAFFFSSMPPSLNADEVIENTLSPVEGGPIMEQPRAIDTTTYKAGSAGFMASPQVGRCAEFYPHFWTPFDLDQPLPGGMRDTASGRSPPCSGTSLFPPTARPFPPRP